MTAITTCQSWLHKCLMQRPQLLDSPLIWSCLSKPPVLTWCPCWKTLKDWSQLLFSLPGRSEATARTLHPVIMTHIQHTQQYLTHTCKNVQVRTHTKTQTGSMLARRLEWWCSDRWLGAVMLVAMETQKKETPGEDVILRGQFWY